MGTVVQPEAQIAEGAGETGHARPSPIGPQHVADAGNPRAFVVADPFVAQAGRPLGLFSL